MNSYKKYVFTTTNEDISQQALETLFKSHLKIKDLKHKGLSVPHMEITEIPEDFYSFVVNQISVKKGVARLASSLLVFAELNAQILCLTKEELQDLVKIYSENLNTLLDKAALYLSDISNLVVAMDNLKEKIKKPC